MTQTNEQLLQVVRDKLKTTKQMIIEVSHAQSCGANWYTRGADGLYQQVAMWIDKGQKAHAELESALDELKARLRWVPVSERPFPVFKNTGISFLAAWLDDDGDIEGVEWYTFDGSSLWNQNSGNRNDFDDENCPTHWIPLPQPPAGGQE